MGRPSKLDDLVEQRVLNAVKAGLTWALAAQAAGVSPASLRDWKARGRDGEEPYAAFLARIKQAEGERAETVVTKLLAAADDPKHWTAGAWWLERRFPRQFGRRDPHALIDKPAAPGSEVNPEDALSQAESVVAALRSAAK